MGNTRILLLTHGGWGLALLASVEMIMGKVDFVTEIALTPELTMSDFLERVEAVVAGMPDGSLVLTDFFGGTTTNVAAKVCREKLEKGEKNIKVICGLNAPMLLEACSQLGCGDECDFGALLDVSRSSIADVLDKVAKSMEERNG